MVCFCASFPNVFSDLTLVARFIPQKISRWGLDLLFCWVPRKGWRYCWQCRLILKVRPVYSCQIVSGTKIEFFQYSPSKEVIHVTEEQVQLWHTSLLLHLFINAKEVIHQHACQNCTGSATATLSWLQIDTRVWQTSTKAFGGYMEVIIKCIIYFIIICKLCATHHLCL